MLLNSVNMQNRICHNQNVLGLKHHHNDNSLNASVSSDYISNQNALKNHLSKDSEKCTEDIRIANLKSRYETLKDEQGVIGTIADGFKNLFNTKNCSNNIEKAINALNENSTDEEIQAVEEMLDKYDSNQNSAINGTTTTGAMFAGGALGAKFGTAIGSAICPGLGTAGGFLCGLVIGAIGGAITNIGLHQVENMTDKIEGNSWQNDENLLEEAGEGALSGASAILMGGITSKVTGMITSKAGSSAIQTGKDVLLVSAEDGSAKVGSTVAKHAFVNAVGSGTGATVVTDGEYVLECALDKNKDFSLTDFGTTSATSFIFGSLIGGIAGGIRGCKSAKGYNSQKAEIKAQAQARAEAQTQAEVKAQQAQEKYNKPFEEKLSNKSVEESAKVFEEQGKTEYEIKLDKEAEIKAQAQAKALALQKKLGIEDPAPKNLIYKEKQIQLTEEQIEKAYNEHVTHFDGIKKGQGINGCHDKEFYIQVMEKGKEGDAEAIKQIFNQYASQGKGVTDVKLIGAPNDRAIGLEIKTVGRNGTTRYLAIEEVDKGSFYKQYIKSALNENWSSGNNKTVVSKEELKEIKNLLVGNKNMVIEISNADKPWQQVFLFAHKYGSEIKKYVLYFHKGKVLSYFRLEESDILKQYGIKKQIPILNQNDVI